MTAHHHLALRDRGEVHVHRWWATCDCGCGWVGQYRRRKREAVDQFKKMAEASEQNRKLVEGKRRRMRPPMSRQTVTPADQLPEELR